MTTRRAMLLSAVTAVRTIAGPADDFSTERYNAFAMAYNAFVNQRERGLVDLKALKRMREAWRRLEKSAGWPTEKPCRD